MTSVYFVEAPGFDLVKIGFAKSVEKRLADLRYAAPTGLVLLKTLPGGRREERALHKRFHEHRSHGEWFKLSPIREAIDALDSVAEPLIERLACVDCGAIRSQHSRDRSKRCRACSAKARTGPAPTCLACGAPVSKRVRDKLGAAWTSLCRSCSMKRAWAEPGYQASIMAARLKRRRKCESCGESLEPNKGSRFHAECWEALSAEEKKAHATRRRSTRDGSDESSTSPMSSESA